MYCSDCGKEIEEEVQYCPHCGKNLKVQACETAVERQTEMPPQNKETKMNALSIIGFVISLISLFLNFFGIVGIGAVIVSVIALMQIKEKNENGKGFALTGVIVGGVSVLYAFMII